MKIDFEIIRGILERRLQQADIERLLGGLSDSEKTQLLIRITELVRRTTALVDVANRVSDTLSLDVLFPRLMEVVTEPSMPSAVRCSSTMPRPGSCFPA